MNDYVLEGLVQNVEDPSDILIRIPFEIVVKPLSGSSKSYPVFTISKSEYNNMGWFSRTINRQYKGSVVKVVLRDLNYKYHEAPKEFTLIELGNYRVWLTLKYGIRQHQYRLQAIQKMYRKNNLEVSEIRPALNELALITAKYPRFETFHLRILLTKKLIVAGGKPQQEELLDIFYMDKLAAFEKLKKWQKFRIFNDLTLAFKGAKDLTQDIETGMTYYDVSRLFASKALKVAKGAKEAEIPHGLVAQLFQIKYDLECNTNDHFSCIKTITSYLSNYGGSSTGSTVRAFFSQWLTLIEKLSDIGVNPQETEKKLLERVCANPQIKDLWVKYFQETQKPKRRRHWQRAKFLHLRLGEYRAGQIAEANAACNGEASTS